MRDYRMESHNLDGRGMRRHRVFGVEPRMEDVYGAHGRVVGETPDYWGAVTDVPCPCCDGGQVRWAEAGYVPGYRICDGCGRHFQADGSPEAPTLVLIAGRRGMRGERPGAAKGGRR